MSRSVLFVAFTILAIPAQSGWSQAFIEHLSPPVVKRGAVNRVEVIGRDTQSPVGLWTSLPAGMASAKVSAVPSPTQGAIDIEVAENAPLGVYGLRLATRSGLSNVHLFVVEELPIAVRDPKLPADAVVPITLPTCVTSECRPAMVDRYSIKVEKGQRVAFEVVGNRLGKDFDPLLVICDSSGKLLAEFDNSTGLFFDFRVAYRFPEAGTYVVELRDARYEGHSTWHYVLRMGDFPETHVAVPSSLQIGQTTNLSFPQSPGWQMPIAVAGDADASEAYFDIRQSPASVATWIPLLRTHLGATLEVEPNDSPEQASPATVPGTLNGVFQKPGDRDWFAFELAKDQKLNIQGVARTIGSAADLELSLFDAEGREHRRVDDLDLDEGGFAFTAGKAGTYRLQVRELSRDGGPAFAYRIDVQAGGPQIQLQAEVADLTIPQGSYQSLPIKVVRTEFPGEVKLELHGAPAGIRLDPDVIPAGASEFVSRVFADAALPEGLHSLRLVGTGAIEGGTTIQAVAKTKPMIDRQLKNVDLIPYGLRADQRVLPPSLQDQIALMIVPPAPFTVELPEAVLTLTRFQTAEFPIVTTRQPGLTSPITFSVSGGQIGDEAEERNQVYARFVPGTTDRLTATGTFFNRINTQLNKHRVDLVASTQVDGRRINLTRSFTLDVRSAFRPTYEPELPVAAPGETVRVKLNANRVSTFDGLLTLTLGPSSGFVFPATVLIPAGQPSVEIEVKVDPRTNPGRHGIRVEAAGFVGKYEESLNLPNLKIEVKKDR